MCDRPYKLCAANYKVNGTSHDGRSLHVTAMNYVSMNTVCFFLSKKPF